jgi:DNA modification methylase
MASNIFVHCAHDGLVPVDSLKPNPRNPNRHPPEQVSLLARIIKAQGWRAPITVSSRSGLVVRGHCRLLAAKEAGLAEVPVDYQDYASDEEELADLVADNRLAELADMDENSLAALLEELSTRDIDLTLTGYDEEFVKALLTRTQDVDASDDEFDVDAAVEEVEGRGVRTRPGEVWSLGRHRLACGDARDLAAVARLMDVRKACCMWTDPPYGVNYEGKTGERLTLENDEPESVQALIRDAFAACDPVLEEGAAIYVAHPAGPLSDAFLRCFTGQGWRLHQTLVWVKDSFVLGHSDYHYRHEPILFGYKPGPGRRGRGTAGWYGDDAQSSVFEVPRPKASRDHPTMKPVELVAAHLRNSSPVGGIVADFFLGSGTTLVAAEQLQRVCRGMDIDPVYCDVAMTRWENLTGEHATRL